MLEDPCVIWTSLHRKISIHHYTPAPPKLSKPKGKPTRPTPENRPKLSLKRKGSSSNPSSFRCDWLVLGRISTCKKSWNGLCQGWFQGLPVMGPPYRKIPPYHSHIFRDSHGSGMAKSVGRGSHYPNIPLTVLTFADSFLRTTSSSSRCCQCCSHKKDAVSWYRLSSGVTLQNHHPSWIHVVVVCNRRVFFSTYEKTYPRGGCLVLAWRRLEVSHCLDLLAG